MLTLFLCLSSIERLTIEFGFFKDYYVSHSKRICRTSLIYGLCMKPPCTTISVPTTSSFGCVIEREEATMNIITQQDVVGTQSLKEEFVDAMCRCKNGFATCEFLDGKATRTWQRFFVVSAGIFVTIISIKNTEYIHVIF